MIVLKIIAAERVTSVHTPALTLNILLLPLEYKFDFMTGEYVTYDV